MDAVAADDGDTTYISPDSANAAIQFGCSNASGIASTDMISEADLILTLKNTGTDKATITAWVSDGTNVLAWGKIQVASTSYADYTFDFTTMADGTAWTVAGVNAVEVRFASDITGVRCTKGIVTLVYYAGVPFNYGQPWTYAQQEDVEMCQATGMYAPRSMMEKGYIKRYAPHDKTRGIHPKRPRTGKTLGG